MLDVGCRSLDFLFQFDESKFKKLIGIDIVLPDDPFQNYLEFKNPNVLELDYDYLEKRFSRRYVLHEKNILDFQIKRGYYGFIFCKHVIHFIPHHLQLQLIDSLYSGLKQNGILYLKINHNQNKQYSNPTKCYCIAKDCFKDSKKTVIHYLNDPNEINKSLTDKYHPELLTIDDKSVTTLIRKK
ncbi:MAG TPA: class I SAM-dependent methyltransferase [Ignavibacteria bacterium]